ncbi:MAG: N-acetyl-alpha-D-glucosaminyl L-malate synthase BshA, partial [Deltaproteobacteria bacterium]
LCFHTLGGSGVAAGELGRELSRRGHGVHFVGAALPGRLDPNGIRLHAVPLEQPPPVGTQAFTFALAARLVEVVQRERIEVIHAHYAVPHAAAAALARAALEGAAPPLVLTLHGTDVPAADAARGEVQLLRKLALDADAVTVPSAALGRAARERLGLPEQRRVEVIPNFVDTVRFSPGPDRSALAELFPCRDLRSARVLCHASNFRPVKRPLDLLHILARVQERMPAVLVLVGDGPERARVEAEARRLGLSADVAFAGAVRNLPPLLRACDLFLLPSAHESFGLAALEAMSCGLPVVGSLTGGLPEVVEDGETGFLANPGDVAAMGGAALRILSDDPLRGRLSRAARDRAVRLFRAEEVLLRWEALYERAVESE